MHPFHGVARNSNQPPEKKILPIHRCYSCIIYTRERICYWCRYCYCCVISHQILSSSPTTHYYNPNDYYSKQSIQSMKNWKARIFPSKICNGGVGLFALQDTPSNAIVFTYQSKDIMVIIPNDMLADSAIIDLPENVKIAIQDLFYSSNNIQYIPCQTPNSLSYAAALNHHSDPNLCISYDPNHRLYLYISTRFIKCMEELTIDYKVLANLYFDSVESGNARAKYLNPDEYFIQNDEVV